MKPRGGQPGWDGHLLLLYHEEAQRRDNVAAWVRRGLEVGAKIFCSEPPHEDPEQALAALLHLQPEALAAMDRGQIEVMATENRGDDAASRQTVVDEALSDGYPLVRWSLDVGTTRDAAQRSRSVDVERATDQLCETRPLSVMCQYPVGDSMGVFPFLGQAHGAGLRERIFQAVPVADGLQMSGELDISNEAILRSLLTGETTVTELDVFILHLGGVRFADVAAARSLLTGTLGYRSRGGKVRLHAAQHEVACVIRLVGVNRAVGVQLEEPW